MNRIWLIRRASLQGIFHEIEKWLMSAGSKVCVALPTSKHLHRQMIEGIVGYARERGSWQLFLVTEDDPRDGLRQARIWGATGVIAMEHGDACVREALKLGVPAVVYNGRFGKPPPRTVCLERDQMNVGKTAADYFLDRGYRSFAFVGASHPARWNDERRKGFVRRLREAGCAAVSCDLSEDISAVRKFLGSLPPGTALFAAHDPAAQRILGLCLELGITVPERLAVLGVDDDCVICEAMTPPLSSIALDGVSSGRQAAQILERLMSGKRVYPVLKLDFPRVVTRQSTDTNRVADTVLSRVLTRITDDLSKPLRLNAIAAELGCSARTLELKAQKVFGCPLKAKVDRLRLNEAVRLLTNSDLPVQEVAERCGFCGASHLGRKMRAAFGYSPSVFRNWADHA